MVRGTDQKEHTMDLVTTTPPEERDELTRLAEAIIDGLGTTGPLSAEELSLAEALGLRGTDEARRCA
jgi:hypothetical protein